MNIEKLILDAYKSAVALSTAPSELKHALKTNERVPRFIAKLKEEVNKLPPQFINELTIINLTTDLTNLFLHNVKTAADQKAMSEAEKHKLAHEMERAAIINKAADTGEITDEVIDALKET